MSGEDDDMVACNQELITAAAAAAELMSGWFSVPLTMAFTKLRCLQVTRTDAKRTGTCTVEETKSGPSINRKNGSALFSNSEPLVRMALLYR